MRRLFDGDDRRFATASRSPDRVGLEAIVGTRPVVPFVPTVTSTLSIEWDANKSEVGPNRDLGLRSEFPECQSSLRVTVTLSLQQT